MDTEQGTREGVYGEGTWGGRGKRTGRSKEAGTGDVCDIRWAREECEGRRCEAAGRGRYNKVEWGR